MLSARELIVLQQYADMNTPQEIAKNLFVSVHTVRAQLKACMMKLDADTCRHAVQTAWSLGILEKR